MKVEFLKNDGVYMVKNSDIDKDFSDFLSNQPLPRVIHGFRLEPHIYLSLNGTHRYVWKILPNRSPRTFFFPNLQSATDFALKFSNNHSDAFWLKRWSTLYTLDSAYKFSSTNLLFTI